MTHRLVRIGFAGSIALFFMTALATTDAVAADDVEVFVLRTEAANLLWPLTSWAMPRVNVEGLKHAVRGAKVLYEGIETDRSPLDPAKAVLGAQLFGGVAVVAVPARWADRFEQWVGGSLLVQSMGDRVPLGVDAKVDGTWHHTVMSVPLVGVFDLYDGRARISLRGTDCLKALVERHGDDATKELVKDASKIRLSVPGTSFHIPHRSGTFVSTNSRGDEGQRPRYRNRLRGL